MVHILNPNQEESDSNIFEASSQNFIQTVIQKSQEFPVVVDFWAPWCGPCKTLTPILEELTREFDGAFRLAKVNIDDEQGLAQQFGVRSVPTVAMVKDGKVVDGFMGAQPRKMVEQFLRKHITDLHEDADDIQILINRGQVEQAIEALKTDGTDESLVRLAGIYLKFGDLVQARSTLKKVKDSKAHPDFKSVSAALEFIEIAQKCDSETELLQRIENNSRDWNSHYQLAAIYLSRGNPKAGLENLLHIVRSDRSFNDDAGRKGMIKAFDMLGPNHRLVSEYRRRLASTLN